MTIVAARRLEFVRSNHDRMDTGRVVLDANGPPYAITMRWSPIVASWYLTLRLVTGGVMVSAAAVRDRVDCLYGVSTAGRPPGAIVSYDPKRRGDPTLDSYWRDDVGLYYLPGGWMPADFAAYVSDVV